MNDYHTSSISTDLVWPLLLLWLDWGKILRSAILLKPVSQINSSSLLLRTYLYIKMGDVTIRSCVTQTWSSVHVMAHLYSFQLPSSGTLPMTNRLCPSMVSYLTFNVTRYSWADETYPIDGILRCWVIRSISTLGECERSTLARVILGDAWFAVDGLF